MAKTKKERTTSHHEFTTAEIGALAHLYRGEVYRSTLWRTRLDTTTNWSVVTLGIALSIVYSSANATPLPLILVGILVVGFLGLEARRYRYFNVWRARARWIETHFYAPMLRGEGVIGLDEWQEVLANDYCRPHYHISYFNALGRRLRRNYGWIFAIQAVAYYGKIAVHPTAIHSWSQLWERAAIGPISGQTVVLLGVFFYLVLGVVALVTYRMDRDKHKDKPEAISMG